MSIRHVTLPTRPREQPQQDTSGLFKPGSHVDVLLAVHGVRERWKGEVVRGATRERPSVELCPVGCAEGSTIQFDLDQVVECSRSDLRPGSPIYAAIAKLQAMRTRRGAPR